jgi:GTP-binding protein
MAFIDQAEINVFGGKGGDGSRSLHREKFQPLGGPDGGDGGNAGSLVLMADAGLRTLIDFSFLDHYAAPDGKKGSRNCCTGKSGKDLVLKVPLGTSVKDAKTGDLIGDLTDHGQTLVVAKGGRGGRGNTHFKTPTHQAPELYEKGEPGQERRLRLEMKILADVGLVGWPNAGKSTLLSVVSAAKPKIANYPFTTLEPQLGVVRVGAEEHYVMADLPGLIEGAADGHGLGHRFLKHLERTRLLLFLIDASGSDGRDPMEDFKILEKELETYHAGMAKLPRMVACNKMDLPAARDAWPELQKAFKRRKISAFAISTAMKQGTDALAKAVLEQIKNAPALSLQEQAAVTPAHKVYKPEPRFTLKRDRDGGYVIDGREVVKWVAMTDFNTPEAVAKLKKIFMKIGVAKALKTAGAKEGDSVRVGSMEFFYMP